MSELVPSILSANFNKLGEQVRCLEDNGIQVLHLDVMDGAFVPSISFGMPVIASLRQESGLLFDVHLMVQEPVRYIKEFVESGADSLTIHAEACQDVKLTLEEMKKYAVQIGVSIKPDTPVLAIEEYLEELDMVLVMSVEPGFGGQKLISHTLNKIQELARIRQEKGYSFKIQIDGGVTKENIGQIAELGADWIVAGTAVFKGDIEENVKKLKEVISAT